MPDQPNTIEPRFVVNLHGKQFVMVGGLIDLAHRLDLHSIQTDPVVELCRPEVDFWVVKAAIRMESGAEWTALGDASPQSSQMKGAYLRHAECVPLRAQMLTKRGWKTYDQLQNGELVLAYDRDRDRTRWLPLLAVSVYEDPQPLVCLSSQSFRAICTPEHTWAVRDAYSRRALKKTSELSRNTGEKIIVAAMLEAHDSLPRGDKSLGARDAAILGWLATDGWLIVRQGKGMTLYRASIAQSKPTQIEVLRALLGDDAREHWAPAYDRTFPSGKTYHCRASCKFDLRAAFLRPFLERVWGLPLPEEPWTKLPEIACGMRRRARAAMLAALLAGDGSGGDSPGRLAVFAQKAKAGVTEAFEILATLQGHALGRPRTLKTGGLVAQAIRKHRNALVSYMSEETLDPEPVWCPTTPTGTWVMKLDGFITITGNTRAIARALRWLTNVAMTAIEELGPDAEGERAQNGQEAASEPRPLPEARHGPADTAARLTCSVEDCGVVITRDQLRITNRDWKRALCPHHVQEMRQRSVDAATKPAVVHVCSVCQEPVDEATATASVKHFNQVLCREHGKELKRKLQEIEAEEAELKAAGSRA